MVGSADDLRFGKLIQPEVAAAARELGFRRTGALSENQHLALLQYLCDEMLETHALRETLQSAPNV